MVGGTYLGIDCGSVSLNLVLLNGGLDDPVSVYRRTRGRPLETLVDAVSDLLAASGDISLDGCLVTGSGRDLVSDAIGIPAINEITAHAVGIGQVDPRVRTIVEIGGQDSKFIRVEPALHGGRPAIPVFRMNEICAAGTGAFLDEQAARLDIPVESFGFIAMQSTKPAPIAGRCAVFAKTDMIHRAQEGAALPDILMGLAFALARNYLASLVRGEPVVPVVSLQGGVMCNQAVAHAFKTLLELGEDEVVTPPHFTVMGAFGCAALAAEGTGRDSLTLEQIRRKAAAALTAEKPKSCLPPLKRLSEKAAVPNMCTTHSGAAQRPVVMGLDVGSVSVKGVLTDCAGRIVAEEYVISHSRPLAALEQVTTALLAQGPAPDLVAVTGSGRYLAGRLMDADLIVNEITAQARAALSFAADVDTVVEIGGQDSKWIAFERGHIRDFEMNRVCAAGTGSFLMEQAERLGIKMDGDFSTAAFASSAPADLGNRCTVFMESDLIHHQNNGAATEDLAAGVCVSIVHNYLDRVANNKPLGSKVLFLGGVAAAPAVKAAFEQQTERRFHVPPFFKVSGALGAALKALDDHTRDESAEKSQQTGEGHEIIPHSILDNKKSPLPPFTKGGYELDAPLDAEGFEQIASLDEGGFEQILSFDEAGYEQVPPFPKGGSGGILRSQDRALSTPPRQASLSLASVRKEHFRCRGCPNECLVDKYLAGDRKIFHGGLCDRWEIQSGVDSSEREDLFAVRSALLNESVAARKELDTRWGMARGPQFYEWFPFWNAFLAELGVSLVMPAPYNRPQFERGLKHIKVETCLPIKAMAGQAAELVNSGIRTIFHPTILTEPPRSDRAGVFLHCPYIQASDQFLLGSFDVEWKVLRVRSEVYADAFREEHARFARSLGCSARQARFAIDAGLEQLHAFRRRLHEAGAQFMASLGGDEQALVVLGKPYHTTEPFLNMNLSSLFHRIGVRAIPGDLLTLPDYGPQPEVYWRYQEAMIRAARAVMADSRLFPVMITFFGCGPDPFTLRHLRSELRGKPLLVLEMDEHASRAGVMTRIEAFVDHIRRLPRLAAGAAQIHSAIRAPDSMQDKSPLPPFTKGGYEQVAPLETERIERVFPGDRGGIEQMSPDDKEAVEPISPSEKRRFRQVPPFHEGALEGIFRSQNHSHSESTGVGFHPKAMAAAEASSAEILFLPSLGDHAYGFAAAARSVGIDARVLPGPDEESSRLGRPHLVGGECHPYAIILGDYLKLARSLPRDTAERSLFFMLGPDACRLGQYPVCLEKVRLELGHRTRVVSDVDDALRSFGLSQHDRTRVLIRGWEGLIAFDLLMRLYVIVRAGATDETKTDRVYERSRDILFQGLSEGRVRQGMEEALEGLYAIPVDESPRPVLAVTGDYYTRVVPFANNDVYHEIERLGGRLWAPPTFSDSYKLGTLQEVVWGLLGHRIKRFAGMAALYAFMVASEYKVKGGDAARRVPGARRDFLGARQWRAAAERADVRLPAGITAPITTTLEQVELGVDGVLNLITLNCSYGTVVTVALARELKSTSDVPMLTLVYDGLKKTNEKTRLEAFMEQVHDRFRRRSARRPLA